MASGLRRGLNSGFGQYSVSRYVIIIGNLVNNDGAFLNGLITDDTAPAWLPQQRV
ncbi:MAG: hypothetical protein ACI9UK_001696 [Candidatus Krumholzibacteriia bacterium]|jgi:hypothetical protein